jgi:hypothetical protein
MIREKVIDLVRKLFAKAESAKEIGSAEEAAAFASKANDLLLQHKLEMTELELEDEADTDPFGRVDQSVRAWGGVQQKWSAWLAVSLARAHFCEIVFDVERVRWRRKRTGTISLFGRQSDRQIAAFLIETLHREAKRLASAAVRGGAHRPSFLWGFTDAVQQRLEDRLQHVKQQGGQYAVVRLQDLNQQLEAYVADSYGPTRTARSRVSMVDTQSYAQGRAAGAAVGIGGISNGLQSASRLLT